MGKIPIGEIKIAYIILAHKNPAQVHRLIRRLSIPGQTYFYVHIDMSVDDDSFEKFQSVKRHVPNVNFLKRIRCPRRGIGLVQVAIEGLRHAKGSDFVVLLSGQDYPIKNNSEIIEKLRVDPQKSFLWFHDMPFEGDHPTKGHICQRTNRFEYWYVKKFNFEVRLPLSRHNYSRVFSIKQSPIWMFVNLFIPKRRLFLEGFKPYGGGQWWCLCSEHARFVIDYLDQNPKFLRYFRYTDIPDEMFFQTLLLNSHYRDNIVNNDLRLFYFPDTSSHPMTFTFEHFDQIAASKQLFARKFDIMEDEKILDQIDRELL